MDKIVSSLFMFIVICCYVRCSYGSDAEDTTEKDLLPESYQNDENTVTLPVYAIYIFGFILVLLVFLVIFLIFVLMKTKFIDICKKDRNDSENTETENTTNSRQEFQQKSLKRLNLHKSHSFEFKNNSSQYQVLKENDSTSTLTSTKDESATLHTPTRTDPSGNISPRIIRGLGKDMPIILPEQMSQICKEVLTRTNKNDDNAGSLRVINNIEEETILADKNEKKYASSPGLDVHDVSDKNGKTCDEKKSSNEDVGNQTQKRSKDICDVPKELIILKQEDSNNQTQSESNNIYDMPKDLENPKRKDFGNQTQIHSDDMYDMPKQIINSNKDNFDSTQISSDNIYDMPKELVDNAQLNYTKPHFPLKTEDGGDQGSKKLSQKSDYACLNAASYAKGSPIDKNDSNVELNAYDFPTNTQTETKMYINANCVI